MASFINKSVFESKAKRRREEEKVLNWSELLQNVIYRINKVEVIEGGKYGTSYILFLVDIDNTKVKVWSSKKLVNELERKEAYDIPYIVSLGQEPYGKTKTINLYDLVFEKGDQVIPLFASTSSSSSSVSTSTSTSLSPPSQKKKKNE